ncbi:MAG: 1-acyl-sn-glycerol-3-phosphate acyltransferase [Anaeroplasmataceae bacterium]|nr:1-acyl-sn-glycerol-3-phosphate acyltransferase [Anaeroplasmataceae bacterium]
MKNNKKRIQYYKDLKNDDFSGTHITVKPLNDKYKYLHKNPLWHIPANFVYFVIAKPLFWLITKLVCHQRYANKKLLRQAKKTGAIIYGNHTTLLADAFVPNLVFSFRRNYIVVSPETLSIKGIKTLLSYLGAMPLTEKMSLKKKFLKALEHHLNKKKLITIYPEAHIWPYYTKIRPFDDTSFKYAALFDKPVFALTNCYQKRKFGKKPKIITYFDGPFYPKPEFNTKDNASYLRDLVYKAMVDRAEKYSTYAYIEYVQILEEEK